MAKRRARKESKEPTSSRSGPSATTIADFAEDLGKLLGRTERKASEWLSQRRVLADQLSAVRDQADRLLRQLTGGAASAAPARAGGGGARKGKALKGRKRPGRKTPMTAAERKAVSERMRKYWAERRAKTARKSAG